MKSDSSEVFCERLERNTLSTNLSWTQWHRKLAKNSKFVLDTRNPAHAFKAKN
jgi:hypothetical protein